jgi:phosphopantetheine--protein transferase-like protein
MPLGTGVDVVDVTRITKLIDRRGALFLQRWFTAEEINYCNARGRPDLNFAEHLAAKEAVFKALPIAWDGPVPWRSIEIWHSDRGRPEVRLSGGVLGSATRAGVGDVSVSLSHCQQFAIAVAVADSATSSD